jgi:hypothetical protein
MYQFVITDFEEGGSIVLELSRKIDELGGSVIRVFSVEIPRNFRADTIGTFLSSLA